MHSASLWVPTMQLDVWLVLAEAATTNHKQHTTNHAHPPPPPTPYFFISCEIQQLQTLSMLQGFFRCWWLCVCAVCAFVCSCVRVFALCPVLCVCCLLFALCCSLFVVCCLFIVWLCVCGVVVCCVFLLFVLCCVQANLGATSIFLSLEIGYAASLFFALWVLVRSSLLLRVVRFFHLLLFQTSIVL